MGVAGTLAAAFVKEIQKELSGNEPLQSTDNDPRLTALHRRISMGLTKRDDKFVMALIVEKPESLAERKAEIASVRYGEDVVSIVTGVAHSARVDEPSSANFERTIGTSIGNIRGSPGSVGCLVTVRSKSREYLGATSAAHVLSMLNKADRGDPIISPGHPDGPNILDNKIGTLADFTFLNHYSDDEKWANLINHADIAVVKLDEANDWPETTLVPIPAEPSRKKKIVEVVKKEELLTYIGEKAFKMGRSSGLTVGTFDVVSIKQSPIRLPDGRTYIYRDMIAVKGEGDKPFSLPGDSGALVYTHDFKALGFVVGGSDTYTFVCTAAECLKSIGAKLVGNA